MYKKYSKKMENYQIKDWQIYKKIETFENWS